MSHQCMHASSPTEDKSILLIILDAIIERYGLLQMKLLYCGLCVDFMFIVIVLLTSN